MAIFMLMDRNKVNVLDAAKDARGCYKLGDIVEVFEDDKPCVIPPAEPFYLVKVAGLKKADALRYMEPEYDRTDAENPVMTRRRIYHIPIDLLPKAIKKKLLKERYLEIEWKTASSYVTNKVTLDTAAGEALAR